MQLMQPYGSCISLTLATHTWATIAPAAFQAASAAASLWAASFWGIHASFLQTNQLLVLTLFKRSA
jgi:hypothetical protein